MRISRSPAAAAGLLVLTNGAGAIDIDASDSQSLRDAASTIAKSIIAQYPAARSNNSGSIPGLWGQPYYWWESGLAFDTLIDYAALTGDDQYNDLISQGMLFQVGPDNNYMPPNQTKSLGNEDQAFWALAAMTAEETGFQAPNQDGIDSWLQLARAVFDTQVQRWDNDTCGGGLRWQIYPFNNGYDYKNAGSNTNFMLLAARLYAQTRNETFAEWFNTAADWMTEVGLYDNETGQVFDGTSTTDKCRDINHLQWSYNAGNMIEAYSYMLATNPDSAESASLTKLLNATSVFFTDDNVLYEVACGPTDTCNPDQIAYRGILARALAVARDTNASSNASDIDGILSSSAAAVGEACTGGSSGTACGDSWTEGEYDGSTGLSQDLSALNVVLANLPQKVGDAGASNSTRGGGSQTSSGGASGTSGGAEASASVETQQQGENWAEARGASMFGLFGAVGFAVAVFL